MVYLLLEEGVRAYLKFSLSSSHPIDFVFKRMLEQTIVGVLRKTGLQISIGDLVGQILLSTRVDGRRWLVILGLGALAAI